MTAEWKEYAGSDEQIAEVDNARSGFILRDTNSKITSKVIKVLDKNMILSCTEYLICNPHPYADMICQWARTGQPVWVRYMSYRYEWDNTLGSIMVDYLKTEVTNAPNWNIPGAEYSFTPFEGEV